MRFSLDLSRMTLIINFVDQKWHCRPRSPEISTKLCFVAIWGISVNAFEQRWKPFRGEHAAASQSIGGTVALIRLNRLFSINLSDYTSTFLETPLEIQVDQLKSLPLKKTGI